MTYVAFRQKKGQPTRATRNGTPNIFLDRTASRIVHILRSTCYERSVTFLKAHTEGVVYWGLHWNRTTAMRGRWGTLARKKAAMKPIAGAFVLCVRVHPRYSHMRACVSLQHGWMDEWMDGLEWNGMHRWFLYFCEPYTVHCKNGFFFKRGVRWNVGIFMCFCYQSLYNYYRFFWYKFFTRETVVRCGDQPTAAKTSTQKINYRNNNNGTIHCYGFGFLRRTQGISN